MAINDTLLNIGANAIRSAATHISLHSALPNAAGSNETTAGRQAAGWGSVSAGDFSLSSALAFSGGAANGAVTHIGYWSAATAGTFYGSQPVSGDATFNSAGEYTLTAAAINSAAT